MAFPDHYQFSKSELKNIIDDANKDGLEIVTTENDYFRIRNLGFENINFLKIKLDILEKNKLIKEVLNYL